MYLKTSSILFCLGYFSFLAIAHPATQAQTPKSEIPIGTEVIFQPGDTTGNGVTTGGGEIVVEFNDYDRWYLSKPDEEQGQWIDLYQALIKSKEIPSHVTFVQFMKIVMDKDLELENFRDPDKLLFVKSLFDFQ